MFSVDEKAQIQALDRTQPMRPLRPDQIERRTHARTQDYKRHGTASLYAAFDILAGQVIGRITRRHKAKEFLAFLRQIDRATPAELDLHMILDNSSTHKTPAIKQWLEKHPRFKLHFTLTGASWLNAVEDLVRAAGKAGAVSGCLHQRGRARVSKDNPYLESLFRTLKYCPQWPQDVFCQFGSDESNKAQVDALFPVDNPRRRHQLVRDFDKWDIRVGQRNVDKLHHY